MGGINSLGGLNKVNVDFWSAIDANAPNNANANQPQNRALTTPLHMPRN